jgi:Domain of unknown function (DUF4389)
VTAIPASYDMPQGSYPVGLDVDPPAQQNRVSVILRLIFVIPAAIVAALVGIALAVVTLIAWFVILITGKYPAGLMSFAEGGLRWAVRVTGYCYLLTDKYPPFSLEDDAAYPIRVSVQGQIDGRNRLTCFFRYIMAIPHLIILGALNYVIGVVAFIAWLIAVFTGEVPDGLHNFIAGYLRWYTRAEAYILLLTDEYPPFGMN